MEKAASPQGSAHAVVQWVDHVQIDGHTHYRIVFQYIDDHGAPSQECLIGSDQCYRTPHAGDQVLIQSSLARVLRIEKAS